MQVSNALTIDMTKSHFIDNILGDWLGSVSYMYVKMVIQFLTRLGGGIKSKVDHRIFKLDSKRGCGGGRGRGNGRGRGVRGDHHYISNSLDPANVWFHGVDCSDFRRRFYGE